MYNFLVRVSIIEATNQLKRTTWLRMANILLLEHGNFLLGEEGFGVMGKDISSLTYKEGRELAKWYCYYSCS